MIVVVVVVVVGLWLTILASVWWLPVFVVVLGWTLSDIVDNRIPLIVSITAVPFAIGAVIRIEDGAPPPWRRRFHEYFLPTAVRKRRVIARLERHRYGFDPVVLDSTRRRARRCGNAHPKGHVLLGSRCVVCGAVDPEREAAARRRDADTECGDGG